MPSTSTSSEAGPPQSGDLAVGWGRAAVAWAGGVGVRVGEAARGRAGVAVALGRAVRRYSSRKGSWAVGAGVCRRCSRLARWGRVRAVCAG